MGLRYPDDPLLAGIDHIWPFTPEAWREMTLALVNFKPSPPTPQETTTMPTTQPLAHFAGHPDTPIKMSVGVLNAIIDRINALGAPTVAEQDERHWETYAVNLIHHLRGPVGAVLAKDPGTVTDDEITAVVEGGTMFRPNDFVTRASYNRHVEAMQARIDRLERTISLRWEVHHAHLVALRTLADDLSEAYDSAAGE